MKFFTTDHSINWVDKNNLMLGYETVISCCEHFGYRYKDCKGKIICEYHSAVNIGYLHPDSLDEYDFSGEYKTTNLDYSYIASEYKDDIGSISFELIADPKIALQKNIDKTIYLQIWCNATGPWYCHGFKFSENDKIIIERQLFLYEED